MKTKVCTKCGKEKEATTEFFHRQKSGKYGLRAKCKGCFSEYKAKYEYENKDKIKDYKSKYYSENKDKIKEYQTKYSSENKEKMKEYQAKYRSENKEKIKERNAKIVEKLKDSYVASRIGISVKDIPKEILETKRLTILLKRELNK